MTQITLIKHPTGVLMPADDETERYLRRVKAGEGVSMNATIRRNVRFHRKFFALLNLGFQSWEPPEPESGAPAPIKSMETFREDVLILAGHRDATYHLDGSVTLRARSISFEKLPDDVAFESIYRNVLSVVWEHVLRQMRYASPGEVDETVNRILRFE